MALTGQITATPVDDSEDDEVRAGRATERDDNQVMIDNLTGELAEAWRATGDDDSKRTKLDVLRTKAGFKKAAKRSITVAGDDRSEAKRLIRRACTLHKVTPVYANDKVNEDGTVRIKWTVGPYTPRVRKAATGNTENPAAESDAPQSDGEAAAHGADAENPPETDADAPTGDAAQSDTGRGWGKRR